MGRGALPGMKQGGRAKGTPNKITSEMRERLGETAKKDVVTLRQWAFDGYRSIIDLETGLPKLVLLSEKGVLRCLELYLDRCMPKLQATTLLDSIDGTPLGQKVDIQFTMVDGRIKDLEVTEDGKKTP
jgi:hypothetical protein